MKNRKPYQIYHVITAMNVTVLINMDVGGPWYPQVHPPNWVRPMVDYRGMLHPREIFFGGENDCKSFQQGFRSLKQMY